MWPFLFESDTKNPHFTTDCILIYDFAKKKIQKIPKMNEFYLFIHTLFTA